MRGGADQMAHHRRADEARSAGDQKPLAHLPRS
jgi:hypothetical protein